MANRTLVHWPHFLATNVGRLLARPLAAASVPCQPPRCHWYRNVAQARFHTTRYRNLHVTMATPNLKPSETVEQQRKRLIYQSRKRGILENDLLLSNFLQHQAKLLSPAELNEIDTLLNDITDWDLYYYLTDKQPVPADIQNLAVWPKLKATVREKRDGVLMMPPLN